MKKIISMVLAFVMVLGCVFALTSCFGEEPELDFAVAKANLEKAGYEVRINDDPYMINEVKSLSASYESEDKYYELDIVEYKDTKSAKLALEAQELQVKQGIEALELEIEMLEHAMEEYPNDYSSDEIKEMQDDIKDYQEELAEIEDNWVAGRSGTIVWYGHLAAVEASKN